MPTTTTPKPTSVAARVTGLNELAESDRQAAQDAAWGWFKRLGKQLPDPAAEAELAELFTASTPGSAVDGQTEGLLVGWTALDPGLDRLGRIAREIAVQATARTMPWLGKRFDRAAQRGTNSLTALAHASRLLAPTYALRRAGDHWEGFDMRNWVEPGTLDPDTEVLVIDYTEGNPWPMTRIRDELVEIVPGTYLGKMIWCQDDGNRLWAYFALKTPVGV